MPEPDYNKLLAIAREPVESSNVAACGYDKLLNIITIEFRGGEVYGYLECSEVEYADLINAKSVGKHFNKFIKDSKTTIKLT